MAKTIKSALRSFVASWGSSTVSRLRAAKIYADAAKAKDSDNKYAFRKLDGFKHWTEAQWNHLFMIGAGILSSRLLDAKNIAMVNCMGNRRVPVSTQEDILDNGLEMARIDGTMRTVPFHALRVHNICQVYTVKGTKRSVEEQVEWLKERERPAYNLLENGNLHIRCGCIITPTDLFNILSSEHAPLGPEALMAIVTRQTRRADHE